MKILYDHQAFGQIIGGVSRSYVELIKHLDPAIETEIAVRYSRNVYLKEILPKVGYPLGKFHLPYKRRLIRKANLKYTISRLIDSEYDLFHATFDDPYFLPFVKTPFVVTVHDLIPERFPEEWPPSWKVNRQKLYNQAFHIITVSHNTKKDLLYYYPEIPDEKVTVVHHGFNNPINKHIQNKWGKYILYVGGRTKYKNFHYFLEAVAPLLCSDKELYLFCTGNKFSKSELELLRALHLQNKVIVEQVTELTLSALYQNALLFVFPSLMEGFGLPTLEAMGNGCPVALSNIPPFTEVAGDAAIYFDPKNIEDIRHAIKQTINNEQLRQELIKKGYKRLELFTWEEASKKLEAVYKKLYD